MKKKLLNLRMMKWLRDTWVVDLDSSKPTWFGAIVIWLLKLIWSVVIVAFWVIFEYAFIGAWVMVISVIALIVMLFIWAMYGMDDENILKSSVEFGYDAWDMFACNQPGYFYGRDV